MRMSYVLLRFTLPGGMPGLVRKRKCDTPSLLNSLRLCSRGVAYFSMCFFYASFLLCGSPGLPLGAST